MIGSRPLAQRRRGGIYVAVLGVAMLVGVIGLAASASVRVQRRAVGMEHQIAQARENALTGAELALAAIWRDPLWRQDAFQAAITAPFLLPSGRAEVAPIVDPVDGNVGNRPTDPIVITSAGIVGSARQVVAVDVAAVSTPMRIASAAIVIAGDLDMSSGSRLAVFGGPLLVGDELEGQGLIDGSADVWLSSWTGRITGSLRTGIPMPPMPPADVIDLYASLGTVISVPGGTIQGRVLGPGVNPFGSTNPDGVYVLNSTGDVTIRDARIHGTLVVRAPGRMVTLAGSVNLAPARADYPALIVEGNVTIDTSSSPLLEVGVLRNLNPPGAPYMGQTDALLDDAYPSEITGLVHVRGDVAATGSLFISGGLLVDGPSGNLDLKGSIAVEWSPSMVNQPLMGYAASVRMVPVAGTWRRVLLP